MNQVGGDIPNYATLVSRFSTSGQWDRVLDMAQQWLSRDPENIRAHLAAGQALINLNRHAEGEPHLEQVLARMPQNGVAHRFMSIIHFNQKRFKAADESIRRAISVQPQEALNWYHLAWMFYRQGDLISAKKFAEKARELNPRNSNVHNLLGLCEPRNSPAYNAVKLEQYRQALELNPQNAYAHNNIGVISLGQGKFQEAEEHFRRALYFQPSLKMARSNLFITIKHRDRIYRFLSTPRDFFYKLFRTLRQRRRENIALYVLLIPIWFLAIRFVLVALALWFLFVWPLVKAYEYLTVGDIRARAGEIGAKKGGLFGYRRWPLNLRLVLFALLLILFWGGVALAWVESPILKTDENESLLLGALVGIGLAGFASWFLWSRFKKDRFKWHTRRRRKQFEALLQTNRNPRRSEDFRPNR